MKRLYKLIFLLLVLTGCTKVDKIGMDSVEGPIKERAPISDQPVVNQRLFTASGGHLVSFAQEGDSWIATVYKNHPPFISKPETLPVYFEKGLSIDILYTYHPNRQQKLIHIKRAPDGEAIVCVGRVELPGGGKS